MSRFVLLILLTLSALAHGGTPGQSASAGQEDELTQAEMAKRQKRREELREMLKSPVELVATDVRQLSLQQRSEMRQQMRQQHPGPSR